MTAPGNYLNCLNYSFIHSFAQQVTCFLKNTLKHTAKWARQQGSSTEGKALWHRDTQSNLMHYYSTSNR